MPSMYRRRPGRDLRRAGFLNEVERLPTIGGRCRLANQKALVFGSDAVQAREHRPVVVIKTDGGRILVVPGTSRCQPGFFELTRGHCPQPRASQSRGLDRTTYLAPSVEVISSDALAHVLCDLNDLTRQRLRDWLREQIRLYRLTVEQRQPLASQP